MRQGNGCARTAQTGSGCIDLQIGRLYRIVDAGKPIADMELLAVHGIRASGLLKQVYGRRAFTAKATADGVVAVVPVTALVDAEGGMQMEAVKSVETERAAIARRNVHLGRNSGLERRERGAIWQETARRIAGEIRPAVVSRVSGEIVTWLSPWEPLSPADNMLFRVLDVPTAAKICALMDACNDGALERIRQLPLREVIDAARVFCSPKNGLKE